MIDLGKEQKDGLETAYPTMGPRKGTKSYRTVCLPLEILEGQEVKLGDEIMVEIKGVVTGINQSEYCNDLTIEAHEGEVDNESPEEEAAEDKKETLLGGK